MLRNRVNIDVPMARLNIYANSFFPHTLKSWNDLDNGVNNLPSVDAFKANHSRLLQRRDPIVYFGGILESAIHARVRIGNSPLKADLITYYMQSQIAITQPIYMYLWRSINT